MSNELVGALILAGVLFFVVRTFLAARNRVTSADAHAMVEEGALLLDVRSPGEFSAGALPDAKNIPLQTLVSRLGELERNRAIVVYCASGVRSARAASLLKKHGLDAHDLGPAAAW